MKKAYILTVAFLFAFFLSAAFAADNSPVEKKESVKPQQPVEQKQPDKVGFDIVILMDSSGSMKKTDPQSYRKPAARLFISLLGSEDNVGVVSFGDSAKVLAHLTQNTKKNQGRLFNAVNSVTSKEFSTNITDAVKKGVEELKSSNRNKVLILMSDGKLALGSKEKDDAAFAELSGFLSELAKAGIKLYSIAFTELSDAKLLEDMAKATGGFFRLAKEDKDLHVIFASIFEKIKSPDTVPLEGDSFSIDRDINEAILLISKAPGTSTTLVDPSKKKHGPAKYGKNMQWYESKTFDMITIKEPAEGAWRVKLSTKEGNKVFVITNLSLKSSFDKGFVNKGDSIKIDAWLEKEGGVLAEKAVLDQVSFAAEITTPDGKSAKLGLQDSAKDGRYSAVFTVNSAGEHALKIAAESKTFKREKVIQFKSVEPPPQKAAQPSVKTEAKKKGSSWNDALIKFGIINLSLLVAVGIFLFARKALIMRELKPKKRKEKK
ncbi:MAG: VWA domain-containing protein [Nitrospirae bacterium]|nr:VWA domain-containing protein [Nitrospirota bacterium]MCL5978121.1 VWA domain-containing protein [Nitrospirota bacterium]